MQHFMMESKLVEVSLEEDQYLIYEISHQHLSTHMQVRESLIRGHFYQLSQCGTQVFIHRHLSLFS